MGGCREHKLCPELAAAAMQTNAGDLPLHALPWCLSRAALKVAARAALAVPSLTLPTPARPCSLLAPPAVGCRPHARLPAGHTAVHGALAASPPVHGSDQRSCGRTVDRGRNGGGWRQRRRLRQGWRRQQRCSGQWERQRTWQRAWQRRRGGQWERQRSWQRTWQRKRQ